VRLFVAIPCLLLCLHFAGAQSLASLPDAPAVRILSLAVQEGHDASGADSGNGGSREPISSPASSEDVTVFPHPVNTRYYFGGQANSIGQVNARFHSPYQGPNSFLPAIEPKVSFVGTFYSAFQPHRNLRYNTDLIVDAESAG
jgi:hypothetical protein